MNELSRAVRGVGRALAELDRLNSLPAAWQWLRTTNCHISKVSTWATRELAEQVAGRHLGYPARVRPVGDRFGVEIYC